MLCGVSVYNGECLCVGLGNDSISFLLVSMLICFRMVCCVMFIVLVICGMLGVFGVIEIVFSIC